MLGVSRRSAILGLAAGMALPAASARADDLEKWEPLLRRILASPWRGQASAPSNATTSGELVLDLTYNFEVQDGMLVFGDYKIESTWDDETYTAYYTIGGSCWERDSHVGVRIDSTRQQMADDLPPNMYWQGLTGVLEFYNDQDAAGAFILKGPMHGTFDQVEFSVTLSN